MTSPTPFTSNVTDGTTRDVFSDHSSPDGTDPDSQSPWESLLTLSEEQVQQSYQIQSAIRWLLLPVAFVLTICNVVVFLQPSMRGSAAFYVVALSLAQLANLALYLVLFLLKAFLPDAENNRGFWIFSIYGVAFCSAIAQRGSYVVMCLFSLERLYAVIKPLHLKTFVLSRRPALMIVLAYLLSGVLHVYVPTKTLVGAAYRTGTRVVYKPLPTPLYLRQRGINDAFSLLAKVALVYLPLAFLLVLIVLTVIALRRHRHVTTSKMTSTSDDVRRRQERQMTVTIFTATVAYVALSLPQAFHHLLSTAIPQYTFMGQFRNLYLVNNELVTILTIFSCTVDFFSFFSTSSSFRTTLYRLLVCPRGQTVVDPTTTTTTAIITTTTTKDGAV